MNKRKRFYVSWRTSPLIIDRDLAACDPDNDREGVIAEIYGTDKHARIMAAALNKAYEERTR